MTTSTTAIPYPATSQVVHGASRKLASVRVERVGRSGRIVIFDSRDPRTGQPVIRLAPVDAVHPSDLDRALATWQAVGTATLAWTEECGRSITAGDLTLFGSTDNLAYVVEALRHFYHSSASPRERSSFEAVYRILATR